MSQTSPVTESAPLAWRYEIQHGPDGETDYAWVYDLGNNLVCTTKTRHAIAIVDAMRGHAQSPQQSALAEFFKWAMREGPWEGGDLEGGGIQDKAESLGLIVKTQFDPAKHGTAYGDFSEGDDYYEFAPGLADTSTDRSPVMQAADKAAKVVEGWSDAKREYAGRVTDSSPNGNSK